MACFLKNINFMLDAAFQVRSGSWKHIRVCENKVIFNVSRMYLIVYSNLNNYLKHV